MRRLLSKWIFALVVLALSAIVQSGWSQTFKEGIRQGLVKVKFAPSMTGTVTSMQIRTNTSGLSTGIASFDQKARTLKASNMYRLFPDDAKNEAKMRRHGLHLWYVVEIDEKTDPKIAAQQFAQLAEVAHAETEREKVISPYKVEPYQPGPATMNVLPFNDPLLKDQWHYNNTAQTGFGDADINVFAAWQHTTGANNITVSVHDEGVDVLHEDLRENIWVNTDEISGNGIDDDANGYVDDINGFNFAKNKGAVDAQFHGTHVAGTIAAVNNNAKGVSGVAGGNGSGNGVNIMSLQILGGGLIERSFVYAANNGAVISQNSWGYTTPGYYDESVRDAIHYFITEAGDYEGSPMRGGLVIFAAGNSHSDGDWYPGGDEAILSVSALGPEWKKAAYSNYGDWVELAAPGGDQINYPGKNGVLSTIPGNKYAYIQGTSMACPHVSGIAALVLANRDHQLTRDELWQKLVTGVVSIDEQNADYIEKLGSGAIDASLAIRNDMKISPDAIADLTVTGMAQEFATLSWTVPNDGDDDQPKSFKVYYSTQAISAANVNSASSFVLANTVESGATFTAEVSSLLGLTKYYFAVISKDRWGNASSLSNIPSGSTNAGPTITASPESIDIEVDATVSTTASHSLTISNGGSGILRWSSLIRHRSAELSSNATGIRYPARSSSVKTPTVGKQNSATRQVLRSNEAIATSFSSIEKNFSDWPTNLVGETDLSIPNSAAGRFYVSEAEGFNLTHVSMYLKHDLDKGPVVVEIFKGSAPTKNNLVYAQEYTSWTDDEAFADVTLDEQIYFENGTTFWVAFHIPSRNLFPLGIGLENETASSTNCFISFNVGASWQSFEEALNTKEYAWSMTAASLSPTAGTYLTLEPGSGDVNSNEETTVAVNADAVVLINGTYSSNLVLVTNDAEKGELRVPVNLTVTGQRHDVRHIDIANFGAGFVGEKSTFLIELDNQGYGNFSNLNFSVSGGDFILEDATPYSIPAREAVYLPISFSPLSTGSKNAVLTISDGTDTYMIALTGVGAETSKISLSPESQPFNGVTIGDGVTAHITVENTGGYPLKYFIPGHDSKGISESWPTPYHKYGYAVRSNSPGESNPIVYDFYDISSTGVEITSSLMKDNVYVELDMGFDFPYYGQLMNKIFIAQKGFTTFDDSVQPLNTPSLNNENNPAGYISPLGTFLTFIAEGKIFYKTEADRLIIQYHNVTDGSSGNLTAQMVLYANGDIRFFYDHITFSESDLRYLTVLIENLEKNDGLMLHNYENTVSIGDGFALGLDYPGPDIVTSVTNGSGILAPGEVKDVEIQVNTASLTEGQTKRYIYFISNDPANKQKNALLEINITSGGTPDPVLSTTAIDFGNVFQGAVRTKEIIIKNKGTAFADVTSITLANGIYAVDGTTPFSIKPGLASTYTVTLPTSLTGVVEDELTIHYGHGATQVVTLTGNILDPPAITADLSAVTESLAYGVSTSQPFSISNPGIANLEVSTVGTQWLSYNTTETPASVSYAVEKHNAGGVYQWIDIRETGVQMPFADIDKDEYWTDLTLPFAFEYFGESFTELKIGVNGVISFDVDPAMMMFTDQIPSELNSGKHIMPYWTFAGFNTVFYPKSDVGIFYQLYDDRVIITWSYLVNFFGGMGDPISAQVIMYKDGMMKFQYRVEEGGSDQTSVITMIGLQNNSTEGSYISDRLALDHGNGLVYTILPVRKHVVAPGETLNGEIILSAENTYGGVYTGVLKINSNVPGSELLEKPVELTINGEATLHAPAEVNFGERAIAEENGGPKIYSEEIEIVNSGTASMDISWIATSSGGTTPVSLQVYTLVDGWMGPTWEWADISMLYASWYWPNPVFSLSPGDKLKARAIFYPSEGGDFEDEIVFTTSIGDVSMIVKGKAVEAAAITVTTESISLEMKTMNETATETLAFDNSAGKSNLNYTISLDFDRAGVTRVNEHVSSSVAASAQLKSVEAHVKPSVRAYATYHRELRYSDKEVPDNHIGTGGSAPFPVATKFNAGTDGFNLSHVETWFRSESVEEGVIEVEVRAGGTSISDAVSLSKETVSFTRPTDDERGAWETIALKNGVRIYPNEDFYVIITYPLGIEFPQGVIRDEPETPERYFYFDSGIWMDLQGDYDFRTTGLLMRVGQMQQGVTSWLTINSPMSGSLAPEEVTSLSLTIESAYAQRGDQGAYVVISSNDPENEEVRIPVNLRVNEAPKFINAPELVSIAENESMTIKININDAEGDVVNVTSEIYPNLNLDFTANILTLEFTPDFDSEGEYQFVFTASDEWGAATDLSLPVSVTHSNEAPEFISDVTLFELVPMSGTAEFDFAAYFEDPNDDAMTFMISSEDPGIIEVYSAAEKFLMKPKTSGDTKVHFVVTDAHGATTEIDVSVKVIDRNRAAEYIGVESSFEFSPGEQLIEYLFSSYFADPDGDAINVVISSDDASKLAVFSTTDKFLFRAAKVGETIVHFAVTDIHGATATIALPVKIIDRNHAPEYTGMVSGFEFSHGDDMIEYAFTDYFKDQDSDVITYTLASDDTEIADVFHSADKFILRPKEAGETTVRFVVTDSKNAAIEKTLSVKVNVILSAEVPNKPHNARVFPNPAESMLNIQLTGEWGTEVVAAVSSVNGNVVSDGRTLAVQNGSAVMDISHLPPGMYFLQVRSQKKYAVVKVLKN
jgi:subtilisin family serine protease